MRSRAARLIIAPILLATLPMVGALAATGSAEAPFVYYSAADGLSQSDVYDIEQDSVGYLWFTTARGLNRYDGKEFKHYTRRDGLPTNKLTALHIDSDDALWVGDANGSISIVRGLLIDAVIEPVSESKTPIIDIARVADRVLVIAEGAGLLEVVDDGDAKRLEPVGGPSIGATRIEVHDNDIRVIATAGMYRLELLPSPELRLVSAAITHLHFAADGTLWVADRDKRVGIWEKGDLRVRAVIDTTEELTSLTTDRDLRVWIATASELHSFDGTRTDVVQSQASMRKYEDVPGISSLFVDRENTLWMSGVSRLVRFLGDRFRHFRLKTEADSEVVWSISEDNEGRMWFGTQTKLLRREADQSLTLIGPDHGIPRGAVRDIVRGVSGDIWAGIRGAGLFRVSTRTLQANLITGTAGLEILDVAVANDGAIWFATFGSGVFRYLPGADAVERFASPNDAAVWTLDVWEDNSVYYGAHNVGIVHLTPQENGQYEQEVIDTKAIDESVTFNQIRVIARDELWVTTAEGGLYRFESGNFSSYADAARWAHQTIYLLEILPDDSLVIGGDHGLYQFYPGSNRIAHYNHLSGFIGTETNVHATFRDSRNALWIGTVDGVTRMDTSLRMSGAVDLATQILHMETQLDGLAIAQDADVDPGQRGIHVEFAAASLLNPRGIEYSYKLIGLDSQWGAATTNRSVYYSRIPRGSYEFVVKARHAGGEWSIRPASRHFTVLPFFWQQLWFKFSVLLLILPALWTAMTYRTKNIDRVNEALRAKVEDRTRLVETTRLNLRLSNEKLSREIDERQQVDRARAEIELRFSRAFDNALIGMGLLDAEGRIFDANPVMRNMFWPGSQVLPSIDFHDRVESAQRENFVLQFKKLTTSELDSLEENLICVDVDGQVLQTVVHLSAVRGPSGDFQYAVMQVQNVTEAQRLTDLLEYQASYDELTGLLNRRSFEVKLTQSWQESKDKGAHDYLLVMDLDQFKVVNDTSGHPAGDQLLCSVSETLRDIVRTDDSVCRLGGDEFGIILWNCPAEFAERIAETIRARIEDLRFQWIGEVYRIGVSIGGLSIDASMGDIVELQQLADAACYAAKEAGRNRVHMVAGEKDSARVRRGQVRWVQRLREAMDNNRFTMYGQVIKPLDETVDEPEHIEILLRMRDLKTRKLIPPGAFLPAAERYGMSTELDRWVITNLIDTLFVHHSFQSEHRQYWVNLSGVSIGDSRFSRFLVDAVKRSPLPPGTINFEITETAVIRSIGEAGRLMAELREMGCRFALDDFGSGLSSFGYLKKLPVDFLKIDGMFIREILHDETDRIFVKSIIDIAHALNIKTVTEFVENEEMIDLIRELGSDYVQGFAIGRPFPLAPAFSDSDAADTTLPAVRKKAG